MTEKMDDEFELSEVEDEDEDDDDDVVVNENTSKNTKPISVRTKNDDDEDNDDDDDDDDASVSDVDSVSYVSDNEDEGQGKKQNNDDANDVEHPLFDALEDDDEDDDEDEHYLQKFDAETQKQIISDFHPELQSHNYDEIDIMSRVVRDEDGNIVDKLHKTLPFISRYEKARILGERAKQINAGGKAFVEVDPTILDGYLIALKEFEEKKNTVYL